MTRYADVPGYSFYYVDNYGRVFSKDRPRGAANGGVRVCKGKQLRTWLNNENREIVGLADDNGTRSNWLVHRLVLLAFTGPPPVDKPEVNHINLTATDNRLVNLEYCSRKENARHARSHGRFSPLHNPACVRKLAPRDVAEIRVLLDDGFMVTAIAKAYNVAHATIIRIRDGVSWHDPT